MESGRNYPRLLVVALVVALAVTGVWAASTSAGAFDAYNRGWEGASELQEEARSVGASPFVATGTESYSNAAPNRTVAVVLSPDEAYTDADARRVREFVRAGGTLVIAEDFGSHTNPLLERLGASTRIDGRLVRDERHYYRSANISVATGVSDTNLTRGVDQLTLNYGSVLEPNGSRVLVETSPFAYVDANRNADLDNDESLGRYPVVTVERIGAGRVVVTSDPSLFINAMIERKGNQRFTRALFADRSTVLLDYSHAGRVPPLTGVTLALRRTPTLRGGVGLLLVGVVLLVSTRISAAQSNRRVSRSSSRERLRRGIVQRRPDWSPERIDGMITALINEETKEPEDD